MDLQAEHFTLKTENSSLKEAMADIVKELADGVSPNILACLSPSSQPVFVTVANAICCYHVRLRLFRNSETSACV